jgi:hypothetical protein
MEMNDVTFLKKSDEEIPAEEYYEEIAQEPVEEIEDEADGEIMDDGILTWEAPEFEHVEKSTTWYWGSMIVAVILMGIALWQKNFLFAVFIMVAELAIFMLSEEKPKMWDFMIDHRGVTIEKHKLYKYSTIKMYDIHGFSDEYHELVLQTTSKVHHYIKMFIHVEDEERVAELLDQRIPRGEIEVTFMELIERAIGF